MSRRTAESKVGELVSQTTGAVVAVVVTVSYTHLDVYKRQSTVGLA